MARPKKEGLDYFPLDVNAGIDDEIELIEAEYGLEGFAIFLKLLQKIYKSNYYMMWTEKEQLQFSKRVNVDINRINVIITSCLKWGLFEKDLFDRYGILTSRGIQRRFLLAIDRRTSYEFYREYLLLSENEVNVYKNLVIVDKTPFNADVNPQSKVKDSKVKYINKDLSNDDENSTVNCALDLIQSISETWNAITTIPQVKEIVPQTTRYLVLCALIEKCGVEKIIEAINNIPKSQYLQGKNKKGVTIQFDWFIEYDNFIKVLENRYKDSSKHKANNKFTDIYSHEWDFNELERLEEEHIDQKIKELKGQAPP